MSQPRDPRLAAELPPVYEPAFRQRVDSVVEEAARLAAAGAEEGTLVWAEEQTAGRGQNGDWASPPGGLYAALVLQPDFPAARLPELGPVALLALGTAVAELLPPMSGLDYRWPNDLLVNGHKVAGVQLARAGADAAVLGIQVNVVPPVEGWEYASLVADGAVETTPGEVLGRLSRHLLDWLQRWEDLGFEAVHRSLLARGLLATPDPQVLRTAAGTVTGTPRALDPDGSLRLDTADGEKRVSLAEFFDLDPTAGAGTGGG